MALLVREVDGCGEQGWAARRATYSRHLHVPDPGLVGNGDVGHILVGLDDGMASVWMREREMDG
jgi:hypothetical protein